ncbi:MAG: DUF177 domain-containing protein [Bacteroidales bacterium]|nr:DUF177 domain-containing protein [Bacteroidales bacterium]
MGKFTEFKLPLKSLPVGTHQMQYRLGKQFFANMESQDVRDADIDVALTLDHRNDLYDLTFKLTGTVTVLCDRCLDEMELPIDTEYHIVVKYGETYNDDSDEFLEIPDSENYLNVAYMLNDTVALAIPIKHVHPLGKCNRSMSALLKKHRGGRPAIVGDGDDDMGAFDDEALDEAMSAQGDADAPTDPRWDKLKELGNLEGGE